jgi:tryptophan halogenase
MGTAIRRVLVVGGGTAGWMAASYLAKRLGAARPDGVEVTLVESADIGIIGVGEGSFSTVKLALTALGIDEPWFLRECSATYKQGNKFVDWAEAPTGGRHSFYYHPFSFPTPAKSGLDLVPYWLLGVAGAAPFGVAMGQQHAVCEARRGPKRIDERPYFGAEDYAYHFDAAKLAKVLGKVGEDLGVKRLIGTVQSVEQDETGAITAVETREQGRLEADLFVDCTGFAARLIGQAMGSPFRDLGGVLFQDSALAGWTWDISLENRRGAGYVYASRYTDDEEAERVLRAYLGPIADGLTARKLTFKVGYREVQWIRNCVAIGLAGGFLEPLEATGIFMIGASCDMLSEVFPHTTDELAPTAALFNAAMRQRYDRVIDFIKMHYCLTRRADSAFWIDNADERTWTDYLRQQIPIWRRRPPNRHDFPTSQESFPLPSYQYVLYGMGFRTDLSGREGAWPHVDLARQEFARIQAITRATLDVLPDHRTLLNEVYATGYRDPPKVA